MENQTPITLSQLVKEAFMRCVAMDSTTERELLLAQLKSDNPALAAEVQALLEALHKASAVDQIFGFGGNGSPTLTAPNSDSANEPIKRATPVDSNIGPGTLIGPYKLLEQIGEGGMGTVFMAQQMAPIKRKVAIKIIKPGMDTQQVVARFEAERQALAMMEHSNIARVLDAGATQHGLPYFVMELVKGIPITEYCNREQLTINDRLKLFLDVCQGVQHAHQKGIIHRDLKPNNVLVTLHDGTPVVKIIDFGIAKAVNQELTDRTLFTQFSQLLGTPLYMSPEQAAISGIDVDTRSDVYSLGVLLYELLTGTTPFDKAQLKGAGIDEIRRVICETEPLRPSRRIGTKSTTLKAASDSTLRSTLAPSERRAQRELEGELDWIVMKALEKDRNRRYESSGAFAADVIRYLNHEQVQACPPSRWYRLSKYVRRNRVLLATTSLVAVSLLVGSALSLWQAVRATQAEKRAAAGSAIARQAVDEMYTEVAEQWLAESGLNTTRRQFLEKALQFYVKFSEGNPQNLDLQLQRLHAMERVAAIQATLGNFAQAERTNQDLFEQATALSATHPSMQEFVIVAASAVRQLGQVQQKIGRVNEAKSSFEHSFGQLKPLLAKTVTDQATRQSLAELLMRLTGGLSEMGLREQAQECGHACVATWQSLLADDPPSWHYRFGLANAKKVLGAKYLNWDGRRSDAESLLLEAEKQMTDLLKEQPTNRKCRSSLSAIYQGLGVLNSWKGNQIEDAMSYHRKAFSLAESLARDYPLDPVILEQMHATQGNLAASIVESTGKHNAESVSLERGRMEVLKKLCELNPGVTEHQSNYIRSAGWHLISLCMQKRFDEGQRFSDEFLRWIDSIAFPRELNIDTLAQLDSVGLFACYSAMLHLESENYAKAAEVLNSLPKQTCYFHSDLVVHEGYAEPQRALRYLINCNAHAMILQRPAEILKRCAILAEQDAKVTTEEKADLARTFRARGSEFEQESQKAFASFSEHARGGTLSHVQLNGVFLKMCDEDLIRNDRAATAATPFLLEHQLVRSVTIRNCRELIQIIVERPVADDSILAPYLTAGPEELRDGDLAVKLAQLSLAQDPPSQSAKRDYAWALFRAGQYQECYEALKHCVQPDAENGAILAMALWHLERRDEARTWLDDRYKANLAGYVQRRKAEPGNLVLPTAEMLLQLDREAHTLLGLESENR